MAKIFGCKSKRRNGESPVTLLKETGMIFTFPAGFLLWAIASYF
ncbi:hypothetical protein [uncultured Sneathiella sp.]|nr:hypothetical protein [uncultured Sneathiella sp.]